MPSKKITPRMLREKETLIAMTRLYCKESKHIGAKFGPAAKSEFRGLCGDCAALMHYGLKQLENCPHGTEKPTCANCAIHCYKKPWEEKMKAMMRFAGPKMLWKHPRLALWHIWDAWTKPGKKSLRKR
jgi:hypothetical protein